VEEDVLIRVGEFIYLVDFVVLKTENVANVANQIRIILGHPFLSTSNLLINGKNEILRLSFGNMTSELNIFNVQRQPLGFDDKETSTVNSIEDSNFDDEFDDMFAA